MFIGTRSIHFFWLLGILLLLGTAVGAGVVLNQPATGTGPTSADMPFIGVVGQGFVDVEDGVSALNPTQLGRVMRVLVSEGDEVKKGDLLLCVDNELQRAKLREA